MSDSEGTKAKKADPETRMGPVLMLISTFVGAFSGGGLTAYYQAHTKRLELDQARQAAVVNHYTKTRQAFLDEQRKELEDIYAKYGSMLMAADDLLELGTAGWQRNAFDETAWPEVEKTRNEVRVKYNAADEAWRSSQGRLALFLVDFDSARGSAERWIDSRNALNTYRDCVEAWMERETIRHSVTPDPPCRKERARVMASLDELTHAAKETRRDAWVAWELAGGELPVRQARAMTR